ncbi:hypothetical protein D9M09_13145 [Janthinobacterium agaricidamnosum]|uniref:Uncharacterized protein n=1 Tax=Janthinobacterium agaricidamnosum TaxID=55508 RepID=A0A3G2EAS8_9BURK|nr:hypothetical protein [Janthinobacterium agaricidamnosum]AYM76636.1 hypothetical protein D9M09_13145 [Janthinobacterium agaricidamnosum]
MCNCKELPPAIADLDNGRRHFDYQGAQAFAAYFQQFDAEDLSPALDHEISNYACKICLQKWYVECAPEQTSWPVFAMKDMTGKLTAHSAGVAAQKAFLEVLAHGGFSEERCLFKHCSGLTLNGRFVCYAHLQ